MKNEPFRFFTEPQQITVTHAHSGQQREHEVSLTISDTFEWNHGPETEHGKYQILGWGTGTSYSPDGIGDTRLVYVRDLSRKMDTLSIALAICKS